MFSRDVSKRILDPGGGLQLSQPSGGRYSYGLPAFAAVAACGDEAGAEVAVAGAVFVDRLAFAVGGAGFLGIAVAGGCAGTDCTLFRVEGIVTAVYFHLRRIQVRDGLLIQF